MILIIQSDNTVYIVSLSLEMRIKHEGGETVYIRFSHYIKIEKRRIKTYGIAVISAKKTEIRKDVSTDGEALKQLVKRMNKDKVSIILLNDIIEDFYAEHF